MWFINWIFMHMVLIENNDDCVEWIHRISSDRLWSKKFKLESYLNCTNLDKSLLSRQSPNSLTDHAGPFMVCPQPTFRVSSAPTHLTTPQPGSQPRRSHSLFSQLHSIFSFQTCSLHMYLTSRIVFPLRIECECSHWYFLALLLLVDV